MFNEIPDNAFDVSDHLFVCISACWCKNTRYKMSFAQSGWEVYSVPLQFINSS